MTIPLSRSLATSPLQPIGWKVRRHDAGSSSIMKILVEMSPEHYDRLLDKLSEESAAYAILKNGVVVHLPEHPKIESFRSLVR